MEIPAKMNSVFQIQEALNMSRVPANVQCYDLVSSGMAKAATRRMKKMVAVSTNPEAAGPK